MHFKKYIALVFLLINSIAFAQTSVQVVVNVLPPYQQNISDYQLHPERIALKLINTETFDVNVQIAANLTGSNGVSIKTKPGYRGNQPIRIAPASSVDVDAAQIIQLFDLSNLDVIGMDRVEFERTGILPEGDYRLCVRAYNFRTLDAYSLDEPIGCSNTIPLYNIEPPIILNPMTETTIPSLPVQNIIFNWTTPAGAPPTLQYILRIVEVAENRIPEDAMMSNTVVPTFEQTVNTNTFLYGPGQPQLLKGKKYAMMVTAKDPFNKMIFRNAGRSEIGWFIMGADVVNPPPPGGGPIVVNPPPPVPSPFVPNVSAVGNCNVNCREIVADKQVVNKNLVIGDELKINKFKVKITQINPMVGGKVSGEGTMPVPFLNSQILKIRVKFTDVQVNNILQVVNGRVDAKVKPGGPNLVPVGQDETLATLSHSTKTIQNIVDFVTNDPLQQIGDGINQIGYEMPIGINSDAFMLAITEFVVTPDKSYFSVVTSVDIPENNDNLGLTARNICMDGDAGICGTMELYLSNDFNIDALGLKLKAPVFGNGGKFNGTFMKLDKNNKGQIYVKDFNVLAEFTFPNKSLVNAATKQPLMTTFEFNANKGWANWKAELTVPEFYVDGAEDIKFDLASKKATYDHSDIENPVGLPSPYKSTDAAEADIATNLKTWHGLYFPEVIVKMPDVVKSSSSPNKGITVTAKHLIFDKSGFTGAIKGVDIITLGDGSLAGWYASVDTVKLDFWKSTFKNSSLVGRLVLPPSGSEIGNKINQLDYKCLLTNPKDKPLQFQFTVKPKNDMQFKAFYAKLTIAATSQILVDNRPKLNDPNKMELFAQAKLDGTLAVDDRLQKIPGAVGIEIPDLEFSKIVIQTRAPYWDEGAIFKFNSPQKKMGGFDVSLTDVKPSFKPGLVGTEAGIDFTGNLNLIGKDKSKFSLAAHAKFGIYSSVTYDISGRFKWEGVGIRVGDIDCGVGADLGALKLTGALKFYNKENPSDCGFVGALAIKLPTLGVGVYMKAQFGLSGTRDNDFKYFSFDAMAEFGTKGIPMFAGVNLYGLGGGITYNMQPAGLLPQATAMKNTQGNAMEAATNKSAVELLNYSPSGRSYTPLRGAFGIRATALFGAVNRNTVDADATFSVDFNEDGGLREIGFKGECRVLTDAKIPLPDRNLNSLVRGKVEVRYDFENKIFDLGVDADLKYPVPSGSMIKANGSLRFNTSPQGWYLHVGRPQTPASVNVMNIFTGKAYFEMGDYNIDPMPGIPQEIKDLAGPMANQIPVLGSEPRGAATTAGFIHGAHTYFEAGGNFLFLYGHLKAGLGYDIAYKEYKDFKCDNIPGIAGNNGWYATGQAYLGANAKIGIDFGSVFGKAEIFEGGAVAQIKVGLPNPSWAMGAITGYYNVFGGVFSGTFNYKFQVGNKCVPTSNSALDFPIIADLTPVNEEVDVEIVATPQIAFNLAVNKGRFEFKQVLDDEKGSTKTKYFKFDRDNITVTMTGTKGRTFTNNDFGLVRGNYNALALKSNDLLETETKYTLTVKVKLLESTDYNGNYVPAKVNGKEFEESKTIMFTTGKGLKTIPNNFFVNSYPLHSHNQFIEQANQNKFSVDFAKNIYANQIDVSNNSTAKIYAVVYKNNVVLDNKLVTVNVGSKAWAFDKFNLDLNTDYRIEFVVKGTEAAATGNSTVTTTTNYGDGGVFKMSQALVSNEKRAVAGLTVAYIKFRTSAYRTYDEKMDALRIYEISMIKDGNNYVISRDGTQINNAAIVRIFSTVQNYKYVLNNDKNTITYTGENFVLADVNDYTTANIFKTIPVENKSFKALYNDFDNIRFRNADSFLDEVTGYTPGQIKSNFLGRETCPDGKMKTNLVFWPSTSSFGSANVLPYVPPVPKYIPGGFSANGNPGNIPNLFAAAVKPPIALANQNLVAPCVINNGGAVVFGMGNIVNPLVNPVGYGAANNANNWGAFNAGIGALNNAGAGQFNAANIGNIGNNSFR
jgi:hypothetical protein